MYYYDWKRKVFTQKYIEGAQVIDDEEFSVVLDNIRNGYRLSTNPDDNTYIFTAPDKTATEIEQRKVKISELKDSLFQTDYQAIKFAEGEISEEEYAPIRTQRAEWRAEINTLETEINTLSQQTSQ